MSLYQKFNPSEPYIPIRISHPISDYGYSIYGNFDVVIKTVEQAKNILDIADMAREAGLFLADKDKKIELRAYDICSNHKRHEDKEK